MTIWTNKSLSEALEVQVGKGFAKGNIIQFNSQDLQSGDVFIALKGANGNGHDYVLDALKRGASCVILEHMIEGVPEEKTAIVKDAMEALRKMAKYKRQNSKAVFIAVTGSAGKTSIKEGLFYTLSHFGKSFASRGSFNNILGISIDLASMADDIKYAIFEVGMNHTGEIREMIPYISPNIALINNILPAHIGNFTSLDGIADAKLEILESMKPRGVAVFNRNSEYYDYCCAKAKKLRINKILSFGDSEYGKAADSLLVEYEFNDNLATNTIDVAGQKISFNTKIGGRHRILNLAAILLIGKILELDLNIIAKNFINLEEPKGRGQIRNIVYNGNKSTIIDDAYNANPIAVKASLDHFKNIEHKYKVAILGDMRELGDKEIEYHKDLLPNVIDSKINKLYTVGALMYELHKILPAEIKAMHFADYKELIDNLDKVIDRDMIILLKASKGMKLWSCLMDELLKNEVKV
jgi:UDP-N-acetylmuramoyl-tripeptide--D-alanyl-D-alanine ligase